MRLDHFIMRTKKISNQTLLTADIIVSASHRVSIISNIELCNELSRIIKSVRTSSRMILGMIFEWKSAVKNCRDP